MRVTSSSGLQQALVFGGALLQASTRRHTRHITRAAGHAWRSWRPAYLPLYAVAGIVGVAVLLLVATAWLRVMLPAVTGVRSNQRPADLLKNGIYSVHFEDSNLLFTPTSLK